MREFKLTPILFTSVQKSIVLYFNFGYKIFVLSWIFFSSPLNTQISDSASAKFDSFFTLIGSKTLLFIVLSVVAIAIPLGLHRMDHRGWVKSKLLHIAHEITIPILNLSRTLLGIYVVPFCIILGAKYALGAKAGPGYEDLEVVLFVIVFLGFFAQLLAEYCSKRDELKNRSNAAEHYSG